MSQHGHHIRRTITSADGTEYLIKTNFTGVTGTVNNGDSLAIDHGAMVVGDFTAVDIVSGSLQFISNELEIFGNDVWNSTGIKTPTTIARAKGRVIKAVFSRSTGQASTPIALVTGSVLDNTPDVHGFQVAASNVLVAWENSTSTILSDTISGDGEMAIVLDTAGAKLIYKDGAGPWTLAQTYTTNTTANARVQCQSRNLTGLGYFAVTSTLFPELIDGTDYSILDSI